MPFPVFGQLIQRKCFETLGCYKGFCHIEDRQASQFFLFAWRVTFPRGMDLISRQANACDD